MGLFKRQQNNTSRYDCVDEEFVYGKDADECPDYFRLIYAKDSGRILTDSIDLISKTVYPETFFSRYKLALKEARIIIRLNAGDSSINEMKHIVDVLIDKKVEIFNNFFDRCVAAGKLVTAQDQIELYRNEIPAKSYKYYKALLNRCTDKPR